MSKSKSKEELFIEAILESSNLKRFRTLSDSQLAAEVLSDILKNNTETKMLRSKKNKQKSCISKLEELLSEKYLTPKRQLSMNANSNSLAKMPANLNLNSSANQRITIDPSIKFDTQNGCVFIESPNANSKATELSTSNGTSKKEQIRNATIALKQLSPGKKALLESLFNSDIGVSVRDLAQKLNQPEEKILELKDDALRSLIYKA